MKIKKLKLLGSASALAMILATTNAYATLQYLGEIDLSGSGLGNVNTLLTMKSPRNTTTESGAVSWNGLSSVTKGDTLAINNTLLLSSLGTNASDLRIIFNASEPGNAQNSITLDDLVATIYSPDGDALWNSGTFTSISFPSTFNGTGASGFAFGLDATQSEQAQKFFDGVNRLGLSASASAATGGNETFFATATPVPEPETYAMMLFGLSMIGFVARRKKN